MAIPVNLAMTAAEFRFSRELPSKIAWMACQFSSCSGGLSNLPQWLPSGSLLILSDQTPLCDHDHGRIGKELGRCVQEFDCCGILLDFQRPEIPEAGALAAHLVNSLPCPVAVTALYAHENDAAVFLPPLPCHIPLRDWTAPWHGRTLWMELALEGEAITLTKQGTAIAAGSAGEGVGFTDKKLHCHYSVAVEEEQADFRLWRTREDLVALLEEAEELGIERTVGLYQELGG